MDLLEMESAFLYVCTFVFAYLAKTTTVFSWSESKAIFYLIGRLVAGVQGGWVSCISFFLCFFHCFLLSFDL
jgi:hypothetical protein